MNRNALHFMGRWTELQHGELRLEGTAKHRFRCTMNRRCASEKGPQETRFAQPADERIAPARRAACGCISLEEDALKGL